MAKHFLVIVAAWLALAGAATAESVVLEDFESFDKQEWKIRQVMRKAEDCVAEVTAADSAAVGKGAARVTVPGILALTRKLVPKTELKGADLDKFQGVSFWVKGDGSEHFGCLTVGSRSAYKYTCYFPLKNREWHQIVKSWDEMVPLRAVRKIGTPGALPPSGIQYVSIGSRWRLTHNNNPAPRRSYCVDHVCLEETVPGPEPVPGIRPFKEVLAKLKARQKVRIVCMGDSLTAGTGLLDRDKERYAVLLQAKLRATYGYDKVFVESRAVGGSRLINARAWVSRDFRDDAPDLATILYGYNDKSSGQTPEFFAHSLNDYLDRIARRTKGRTAIALIPTLPGRDHRFVMMDDFAEAARKVGRARNLPCIEAQKVFKALGREKMAEYLRDTAHPNAMGHQLIADTIARFLR